MAVQGGFHDCINMGCLSVSKAHYRIKLATSSHSTVTSNRHRNVDSVSPCLTKISSISRIERHRGCRMIHSRASSFRVQLAGSAPQAEMERTIWLPSVSSPMCPLILRPFCMYSQAISPIETDVVSFVGHQSVYKWRQKDTVINCIDTNEFVWNMPT
jgi:hypothetical protein